MLAETDCRCTNYLGKHCGSRTAGQPNQLSGKCVADGLHRCMKTNATADLEIICPENQCITYAGVGHDRCYSPTMATPKHN